MDISCVSNTYHTIGLVVEAKIPQFFSHQMENSDLKKDLVPFCYKKKKFGNFHSKTII